MKKRVGMVLASAAALISVATSVPVAQAARNGPAASGARAFADGRIHAWSDPNQRGDHCAWVGFSRDWDNPGSADPGCLGMKNRASSVANYGFPGGRDKVNLYYNEDQGGVYACIGQGDTWSDLSGGRYIFDHGWWWWEAKNTSIDNNIASHGWTDSC
ncbi:hypothetical protein [Embleya sp. MST-111070]|uniref:hypothetical protein n=1 Tax=Embleya sp. MST-111070 TaxID=3398231 RepID=UPI003F738DC3